MSRLRPPRRIARGQARALTGVLQMLLRTYPWSLPTIIMLGVLAALAEGIGLSLFIPLLQAFDPADAGDAGATRWLFRVFDQVPTDQRVAVIGTCILVAIVLRAALGVTNTALFAWLDARISHRLRAGIFDQMLTVSYRYFEQLGFGRQINTLATETWRTSDALGVTVQLIIAACTVVVYVALLLLLSPLMTAMVAAAMLVVSLLVAVLTRSARSVSNHATKANAALTDRMIEGVGGMSVIRAFNRQEHEQRRFDVASNEVSSVFMRLSVLSGIVGPVHEVLSAILLLAVVLFGLRSPGNVPVLLVFLFGLYRLQPRIMALEHARTQLRTLAGAVDDVTATLRRDDKPYLADGDKLAPRLHTAIELRHVTFRYAKDEVAALRDVSIKIPAQHTTAIVGPSGAGKSTLIKLLFRFYDPDAGSITVDGVPLEQLQLRSWREHIALVGQEVHLFNATVRENIGYGRPDATCAELQEAARFADAHDFITRLPAGYDTVIGDRGLRLSGGQRQRLALARAVIRDPDILILDEATNALDSRSERSIQRALDALGHQRTIVVIAHRFSTIEQADQVVVLDGGMVREQGSHGDLLMRDGLYQQLHAMQGSASSGHGE